MNEVNQTTLILSPEKAHDMEQKFRVVKRSIDARQKQHSLNDVPLLHIANDPKELKPGKLADLAPTLLDLMDIKIPGEMTGESLLKLNKG